VGDRRDLRWDITVYVVCAAFAIGTAIWSEFYGYRVWGNFASVAYVFGAAHAVWLLISGAASGGWPRSRWLPVGLVAGLGMIVPLGVLVVTRLTGTDWLITPWSWSSQPEVWVIERSARLLLDTGTPYVDIAALADPQVNDYTPYGPVMTVFGLPRALLGGPLTDARIMFALVAVVTIALSLRLLGWPKVPVRAAHLAIVSPLTALTFAVAGPDLAIIGLLVLAGALAVRDHYALSAVMVALVVSMKLTALPAVVVIFFLIGARAAAVVLARVLAVFLGVTALLNIPVLIVQPGAFVEHVIKFPAGAGRVSSPAASPFPGHLIAQTGPAGHVIALVLVGITALALMVWLVRRPPMTGSAAMTKAGIVLAAALLVVPASRYGYLVYPLVLWGAAMAFAVAERAASRPATACAVDHPAAGGTRPGADVGEPR
jgi:glycosyl transferase family 87